MRGFVTILMLALLAPVGALAAGDGPEVVTLERVAAQTLEKNFSVLSTEAQVLAQMKKIRKARAALLPTVNLTGVYTRIGVVPEFEIPGFENIKFVNPDTLNFSLGVKYNLFDWGMSRDQIKLEELGLESTQLSALLLKKGLVMQVSMLYLNILQIEEGERVILDNIAILEKILDVSRRQFDGGFVPEHQVLQTQSVLESLKAQKLQLEQARAEMVMTLKNVSGRALDSELALQAVDWDERLGGMDLDPLVERAFGQREDLMLLSKQEDILGRTRDMIGKTRLPLVSAGLNAELRNGIMPDVEKLKMNWSVGLTVVYNLFDGNASKYEQEALGHQLRDLEISIEKARRDVEAAVRQGLEKMERLGKIAELERKRLEISRRGLELARQSFEAGQAGYLDVLNARSNVNMAENNVIAAKYQRYMQWLTIRNETSGLEGLVDMEAK